MPEIETLPVTTPTIEVLDLLTEEEKNRFSFSQYFVSEREVLIPALERHGYTVVGAFRTVEGDAFGPLIRGITLKDKDGATVIGYYG